MQDSSLPRLKELNEISVECPQCSLGCLLFPMCFLITVTKSALVTINCHPGERNDLSVDGSAWRFGCFRDATDATCTMLNYSSASPLWPRPPRASLPVALLRKWCFPLSVELNSSPTSLHPVHVHVPICTLIPKDLWVPSTSPHCCFRRSAPHQLFLISLDCLQMDLPPLFSTLPLKSPGDLPKPHI